MIARMKKVTLLVSNRGQHDFLLGLRKAGVVHIKHIAAPSSEDITSAEEKLLLLSRAVNLLPKHKAATDRPGLELDESGIIKRAEEIVARYEERESASRDVGDISSQMEWFRPWGGFNPDDLENLKKEDVTIRLYRLRKGELREIKGEHADRAIIVREEKGFIYLAFVSYQPDERLPFDEIKPPEKDLQALRQDLAYSKEKIKEIGLFLEENAPLKDLLKKYIQGLNSRLKFLNVKFGMKDEGGFSYLQGFCPAEDLGKVVSLAKSEAAGYLAEEPDNPAETPTLIKNPRWISIIEPVFKFMNTRPGYRECDISLPFLVFFSVFFAMLIGDAGYGLLFMIVTYLARRRLSQAPAAPFFLMYVLSFATLIWGAITGTWFGFERIAQLPFLNILVIDRINSFVADNQNFTIYLCFIIGVVHLSIAHLMAGFRMLNSLVALAHVGWVLILWGLFFVAGRLVLDNPLPELAGYLLIAGGVLVLLFSNPQKNIIKGILLSLLDVPLKIISSFADIVSYLRLFAVGYATVIVASSFNDMAIAVGFGNVLRGFGAALILFFGHALNVLLGLMSVIVHGIRLNMLEFSGHLDLQWSGKEYQPFKED